ncbi:MAG: SDR family oxidoreductase [Gracilibacteraceae bacterium]|nr:SDR family oxidoreductase [Gracilibacteraceae bacterium]
MRDLFDIKDKKAVVTGGAAGLGQGIAEALAEFGARVVVVDNSARLDETAREMRERGLPVSGLRADLSDTERLESVFNAALEPLDGVLDILVNCAGIQRRHKCEEFPLSDWNDVLTVNLTSVFRLCQLAGQIMLRRGSGKIINISSMLAFFGGFTVPAYAASKGGVSQLTKALSNEWAGRGVNVNAIAPGYMDTALNVNIVGDPGRSAEILGRIPAGRWGTPEDLQGVAVFLASAASDYLSGAVIPVDGGYLGK